MIRLLVAALLGCLACDVQATSTSGTAPVTTTRIIGGTATQIASYPYLVSLESYGSSLTGWYHDCGGSILSSSVVLTAAHCVSSSTRTTSNLRIRAGSTTRGSGGQVRQLQDIAVHPKYNEDTDDYDVAVLVLTTPLAMGSSVKAVTLPTAGVSASAGEVVSIAGWGVTNTATASVPTTLMQTSLNIVSRQTCSARYYGVATITTRMICAYAANTDSCQGDSGGPMVDSSGVQVGVVSFGVGCAQSGYPGVYADVSNTEINSFIRSYLDSEGSTITTTSTTTTTRPTTTTTTTPRPTTTTRRPTTTTRRPTTTTRRPTTTTRRPTTTTRRPITTTRRPSTSRPSQSNTSSRPSSSSSSSSTSSSRPSTSSSSSSSSRPSSSRPSSSSSSSSSSRPSTSSSSRPSSSRPSSSSSSSSSSRPSTSSSSSSSSSSRPSSSRPSSSSSSSSSSRPSSSSSSSSSSRPSSSRPSSSSSGSSSTSSISGSISGTISSGSGRWNPCKFMPSFFRRLCRTKSSSFSNNSISMSSTTTIKTSTTVINNISGK